MKRRLALLISLIALAPASLAADSVVLKDGRRFDNVRATLGRDALVIQTEDGRRLTFAPDELKELRYAPLRPTPAPRARETERELERLRTENAQLRAERERRLQAETRLAEREREAETLRRDLETARTEQETLRQSALEAAGSAAAEQTDPDADADPVATQDETPANSEPTPESDCGFGRPFLEGWIPFWSPHYCSGRYKTGVLFTALETATLYNALLWLPAPRKRGEDGLYQLAGLVTAARVSSGVGEGALVWLYWNQAGQTTYYHPRSRRGFIEEADFNQERRFAVFAFLFALFLDGASAHYFGQSAVTPEADARSNADLAPAIEIFPVRGAAGDEGLALELSWRF